MSMFRVGFFSLLIVFSGCRSASPLAAGKKGSSAASVDAVEQDVVAADGRGNKGVDESYSDFGLWRLLASGTSDSSSRAGVARCRDEGGFVSCFVQAKGGAESLMSNALSVGLRKKILVARKDVDIEPRIIADVTCEILGKKTPPFSEKEDAKCLFSRVRAHSEAVYFEDVAFELAGLLRGESILGETVSDLSGIISCRVLQRDVNAVCTVRRITRGGISDDARELGRKESLAVSSAMVETLNEIRRAQSQAALTEIPRELAGSVRCVVDGSALEAKGSRKYDCSIRL